MKLSQLSNDQAADALATIEPYVEELIMDDELAKQFKQRNVTTDKSKAKRLGFLNVFKISTYLVSYHREATWGILATINQKDVETYRKQNFMKTVKEVMDAVSDQELLDFFSLSSLSAQET